MYYCILVTLMLLNANKYLNTIIKYKYQYQYMTEGVSMSGLYMASFIFFCSSFKICEAWRTILNLKAEHLTVLNVNNWNCFVEICDSIWALKFSGNSKKITL